MAELKTKKNAASVTVFIDSVKDPQRRADAKQLLKIFKAATGMKPVMWGTSIIGFGSYHYKSERSTQEGDWMLTAFSPRAQNLTVYIMSGAKNYGTFLKKLDKPARPGDRGRSGGHKISGGSCIYINRLSDIHIPTLTTLIKASVRDVQKKYKTS